MAKNPHECQRVVMVCTGSDCKKKGSQKIMKEIRKTARKSGEGKTTFVLETKCTGMCKHAPVVCIQPANVWLTETSTSAAVKAVKKAL